MDLISLVLGAFGFAASLIQIWLQVRQLQQPPNPKPVEKSQERLDKPGASESSETER